MVKKRPLRYWLLYLASLPGDVIAWVVVFAIWFFWGTKLHWYEGLWCELKPDSWPTRTWYRVTVKGRHVLNTDTEKYGTWLTWGGTTLGHGGFFGPCRSGDTGIDSLVEAHERVHVEQYEVAMVAGSLLSVVQALGLMWTGQDPNWAWLLTQWVLSALYLYGISCVVAWLRGENPYFENAAEENAYDFVND